MDGIAQKSQEAKSPKTPGRQKGTPDAKDKEESPMYENTALTEAIYYILLSLLRPNHGYGIMQSAEELSHGRVRLAAGTLYGALNSLCDKGWIVQLPADPQSRRKEYEITERGRKVLMSELDRLRELVRNGEMMTGAAEADGEEGGRNDG